MKVLNPQEASPGRIGPGHSRVCADRCCGDYRASRRYACPVDRSHQFDQRTRCQDHCCDRMTIQVRRVACLARLLGAFVSESSNELNGIHSDISNTGGCICSGHGRARPKNSKSAYISCHGCRLIPPLNTPWLERSIRRSRRRSPVRRSVHAVLHG